MDTIRLNPLLKAFLVVVITVTIISTTTSYSSLQPSVRDAAEAEQGEEGEKSGSGAEDQGGPGDPGDPEDLPFDVNASSGYLMDATTGTVLYSNNANERLAPASLVKIMTLLLAFEALEEGTVSLETLVLISENAWRTGGSKMFVLVGSEISVENLIAGIAIVSGNDACVAIAEGLAGTEEGFIARMNQRAEDLGLDRTEFKTVHGLDAEGQFTTARDVAVLSQELVTKHPQVLAYTAEPSFTWSGITQSNTNLLIFGDATVDGLKTGHTDVAGWSLAATAEREGMRLVSVIMGAPTRQDRRTESDKLLEYGFFNFRTGPVVSEDDQVTTARVFRGVADFVGVGPARDLVVTVRKDEFEGLAVETDIDQFLSAPITPGDRVGTITVLKGEEVLVSGELVAQAEVARAGLFKVIIDTIRLFFARAFGG